MTGTIKRYNEDNEDNYCESFIACTLYNSLYLII
jgi:hypothetical protein